MRDRNPWKWPLFAALLVLYLLHNDLWLWHDATLVFGLPVGLVYAFYEKDFSFAKFLGRHPEHRLNIIHLLVGNVEQDIGRLFDDMSWMVRVPEAVQFQADPVTEMETVPGAAR